MNKRNKNKIIKVLGNIKHKVIKSVPVVLDLGYKAAVLYYLSDCVMLLRFIAIKLHHTFGV